MSILPLENHNFGTAGTATGARAPLQSAAQDLRICECLVYFLQFYRQPGSKKAPARPKMAKTQILSTKKRGCLPKHPLIPVRIYCIYIYTSGDSCLSRHGIADREVQLMDQSGCEAPCNVESF